MIIFKSRSSVLFGLVFWAESKNNISFSLTTCGRALLLFISMEDSGFIPFLSEKEKEKEKETEGGSGPALMTDIPAPWLIYEDSSTRKDM